MSPPPESAARPSSGSNIRVTRYVLLQIGPAAAAATAPTTGIVRIELLPWRAGMNLPEFLADLTAARRAAAVPAAPAARAAPDAPA
ncbi:MAG: hypothetical protein ACREJ2_05685, partial [Planctomycetota bacterium]